MYRFPTIPGNDSMHIKRVGPRLSSDYTCARARARTRIVASTSMFANSREARFAQEYTRIRIRCNKTCTKTEFQIDQKEL